MNSQPISSEENHIYSSNDFYIQPETFFPGNATIKCWVKGGGALVQFNWYNVVSNGSLPVLYEILPFSSTLPPANVVGQMYTTVSYFTSQSLML